MDPKSRKPSDWSQGLSPDQQAEWLVDCYRMRVDDDYAWGGMHTEQAVTRGGRDTVILHVVAYEVHTLHSLVVTPVVGS